MAGPIHRDGGGGGAHHVNLRDVVGTSRGSTDHLAMTSVGSMDEYSVCIYICVCVYVYIYICISYVKWYSIYRLYV